MRCRRARWGWQGQPGWLGTQPPLASCPPWGQRWLGGCPWCPCSSSAGPSHWKELKATCGGDKQSPVNIDRRRLQRDSGLGDILFEGYDQAPPGKWRLANNGHTGACCGRAPCPRLGSATAPGCFLPSSWRVLGLLLLRGFAGMKPGEDEPRCARAVPHPNAHPYAILLPLQWC